MGDDFSDIPGLAERTVGDLRRAEESCLRTIRGLEEAMRLGGEVVDLEPLRARLMWGRRLRAGWQRYIDSSPDDLTRDGSALDALAAEYREMARRLPPWGAYVFGEGG